MHRFSQSRTNQPGKLRTWDIQNDDNDDEQDSIWTAFVGQARGANELNNFRMSNPNLAYEHPEISNVNWPLRTVDITDIRSHGSLIENAPPLSGNTLRSTSEDPLIPQGSHPYENTAAADRRSRATMSGYWDDIVSTYAEPHRSPSSQGYRHGDSDRHSYKDYYYIREPGSGRPVCSTYTTILLILTSAIAIFTALYASGVVTGLLHIRFVRSDPSHSLLVLRILSEIATVLLWALALAVMQELQWALASRPQGVNLVQFVQLDLGTGFCGLLKLVKRSPWKYKGTGLIR
jgi:hypothetical protein